jgi:ubiquinone/menaquinone biosynthesis C-methylase UbiE
MDLDAIKKHWEEQGESLSDADKVTPTSRDPFLGELEETFVMKYLDPAFMALDAGCGDASHTIRYARNVNFIHGLDIAESLIGKAKNRAEESKTGNMMLHAGSILDMEKIFAGRRFDCIISQRCIINLPTWDLQKEAMGKMHGMLKKDGLLIMTEGFQDELDNLNTLRTGASLPAISVVSYNRNLRHKEFDPFIRDYFHHDALHDYGLYLFLSRVYHPMVVSPEAPRHDSRLNEVAGRLSMIVDSEEFRKYSYNLCYVLKKK